MAQGKLTATARIKTGGKVVQEGESFTPRDEETAESLVSAGLATRGGTKARSGAESAGADGPVEAPLQETVPAPVDTSGPDGRATPAEPTGKRSK